MSFNTDSNFDTTGRREGFNDTQGDTASYGTGTGSGAYDPANTGLGGYGGNTQASTRSGGADQFSSQQQPQQSSFDDTSRVGTGGIGGTNSTDQFGSGGNNNNNNSDSMNATWDRSKERSAGFQGDDGAFGNTDTGRVFNAGTPTSGTGIGGTGSTDFSSDNNGPQRGGYPATGNLDEVNDQIDQTHAQGQQRDREQRTGDNWDQDQTAERAGGKPSFGEKMRGNMEKLAGSVTGNQDLKSRGQERKTGDF